MNKKCNEINIFMHLSNLTYLLIFSTVTAFIPQLPLILNNMSPSSRPYSIRTSSKINNVNHFTLKKYPLHPRSSPVMKFMLPFIKQIILVSPHASVVDDVVAIAGRRGMPHWASIVASTTSFNNTDSSSKPSIPKPKNELANQSHNNPSELFMSQGITLASFIPLISLF